MKLEALSIAVTDDGYTQIKSAGMKMSVAAAWNDLDGFRDLLVKTLTDSTARIEPLPCAAPAR